MSFTASWWSRFCPRMLSMCFTWITAIRATFKLLIYVFSTRIFLLFPRRWSPSDSGVSKNPRAMRNAEGALKRLLEKLNDGNYYGFACTKVQVQEGPSRMYEEGGIN